MDWLLALCCLLFVGSVSALVVLWNSDCDLRLLWSTKFGKTPECLAGKVVWITGASSGIGEALAHRLAAAGCRLVLSARRHDRLNQTKEKCLDKSVLKSEDILVLPLDMLEFNTHAAATETVLKYFKKIDILVNNAGRGQLSLFETTPIEVEKQLFEIDVFATVSLTKAVLPHMVARGQGHFVVTSSVAGKVGAPGLACYSGAKHALQIIPMDWLLALCWLLFVGSVSALVVLWNSDCDLRLLWSTKFGKTPECLAGKVVWITGASSGIGEALAHRLAAAGCRLVLSARRYDRLNQTKEKCLDKSVLQSEDILVLPLDMLEFNTHTAATETVLEYFKKIDILVNNAGRGQLSLFETTPIEVEKQLFEIDVFATVSLTKAVLPHMVARGQGHFVVTSSLAGKVVGALSDTEKPGLQVRVGKFTCNIVTPGVPGLACYSGAKHALQRYQQHKEICQVHRRLNVV